MVNRGRPSPACFPCRSRKLRCDLKPDICGQCRRAKITCHGYRDPGALQFRDESLSVEQKAIARRYRNHPPQYPSHPNTLELSWDARARYAFFSTYVRGFTRSMGEVATHYRAARAQDHLSASVEAASLAFMATQLGSSHLMHLANASYLTAIRRLNSSLSSMSSEGAEEALQSVLLLDMYEKMVHRDPQSSQSWISHARGGLSLLDARESSIISSPTGCQLASRLVTAATVSCATLGVSTPRELSKLRRNIGYRVSSPKWSFLGILGRVSDLHLDIKGGHISKADFLVRAKSLDDQLEALDKNVPPEWKPNSVEISGDNPIVLGTCYDVYQDHYTAQVYNALRSMRLILYSITNRHVPEKNYTQDHTFREAMRDLTHRVCASVPHYMLLDASPTNTLPFSPVQQLQCSTFLTPLYFVHQITDEVLVKNWVARCFRFMGETGGLRAAKDLADVMETWPELDYWTVFAMTGSYAFAA